MIDCYSHSIFIHPKKKKVYDCNNLEVKMRMKVWKWSPRSETFNWSNSSWSFRDESATSWAEAEAPSFGSGASAVILLNNRAKNMEKTKILEVAMREFGQPRVQWSLMKERRKKEKLFQVSLRGARNLKIYTK